MDKLLVHCGSVKEDPRRQHNNVVVYSEKKITICFFQMYELS